jgi:hypothetical protein
MVVFWVNVCDFIGISIFFSSGKTAFVGCPREIALMFLCSSMARSRASLRLPRGPVGDRSVGLCYEYKVG